MSDPTVDRLRDEVDRLRAAAERLVLAADEDRREIERRLHAGPLQELVAVAVELQLAAQQTEDPPAVNALIEQAGEGLQSALDEMTRLAERIYPPLLRARGLAASLRAAAGASGVSANVDVAEGVEPTPVIAQTLHLLWLNALDHAGAEGRATLRVRADAGSIVFDVSGAAGPEVDRLRDRVEALGGTLASRLEEDEPRIAGRIPLSR